VIEVDIGMQRAGVSPARRSSRCRGNRAPPGLALRRGHGWESQATRMADPVEKERTVVDAIGSSTRARAPAVTRFTPSSIVSCGGTGTFPYCAQQPGVTEVQAAARSSATSTTARTITCISRMRSRACDRHQPADADAHRARRGKKTMSERRGACRSRSGSPRRRR
jgi:D-serine deaminase-like pyridoxal phosphate-dependent protein